jgi:hypothetical protein
MPQLYEDLKRAGLKRVCYRHAYTSVHGGISPFSRHINSHDSCALAPIMLGLSDLVLERLGMLRAAPSKQPPAQPLLSQAQANWFRAAFDNPRSADRASPHAFALNLTVILRHGERAMQSTERLVGALRELPYLHVESLYLDGRTLKQQVEIAQSTDILVGVHGAGLIWDLYLRRTGALVELRDPSRSMSMHYASISTWIGVKYIGRQVHTLNFGDGDYLLQTTVDAVREAAVSVVNRMHDPSLLSFEKFARDR